MTWLRDNNTTCGGVDRLEAARNKCKEFNANFMVGQPVWVERCGENEEAYIRSKAWACNNGDVVISVGDNVEGTVSHYTIDRISHRHIDF